MMKLVWRWGKEDDQWTVFGFTMVHFSDLPAAPFRSSPRRKPMRDIDRAGYVDNGMGGIDEEKIDKTIGILNVFIFISIPKFNIDHTIMGGIVRDKNNHLNRVEGFLQYSR